MSVSISVSGESAKEQVVPGSPVFLDASGTGVAFLHLAQKLLFLPFECLQDTFGLFATQPFAAPVGQISAPFASILSV